MRIVNLTEFRKLPAGVVFCKYTPCYFGQLQMKGETWEVDFLATDLTGTVYFEKSSNEMFETCDRGVKTGESFPLEVDCFGRDGLFEKEQLFGIYDSKDIRQLIDALSEAQNVTLQLESKV